MVDQYCVSSLFDARGKMAVSTGSSSLAWRRKVLISNCRILIGSAHINVSVAAVAASRRSEDYRVHVSFQLRQVKID